MMTLCLIKDGIFIDSDSSKEGYPYPAVECQEVAADGVEAGPQPGIDAPFAAVGTVECFTAFSIETDDSSLHILQFAILGTEVPVASQRHIIAFDADDSVKYKMLRGDFCQYGVAHFGICGFGEQCLVAPVFQKGAHAESFKP